MTNYFSPGIYVEELPGGPRPIQAVGTSTAGFVGVAPWPDARVNEAVAVNNWQQFVSTFVQDPAATSPPPPSTPLSHAVFGFFQNGGARCYVVNIGTDGALAGGGTQRAGLQLFEEVDEVAIVAAPGYCTAADYEALLSHCELMRDRVAILDPAEQVTDISQLTRVASAEPAAKRGRGEGGEDASGPASGENQAPGLKPRLSDRGFGAFYFPRITVRDVLHPESTVDVAPSGHLAGVWARSDAQRGVHKAPANEPIRGALNVTYRLTTAEQDVLNPEGVNCIRWFSREGIRVWGARTVAQGASEWRYLNVRRLFNMIEESILLSTRWIVFEPNDRTLWNSILRDVTAFLTRLWRDGALMGRSPQEAFFVKCDEETNPPDSIDDGRVIILIGIAPVKPAEFIIFRISQSAAGAEVVNQGAING